MPSSPFGSTDGPTTSGVAFRHRIKEGSHSRTASGVALHHRPCTANTVERRQAWHAIIAIGQHTRSNDVGHGMTSPPLDSTHNWQRQAWHDITALGQHTRSDYVGHGMKSPPLDSTHGRTTSGVTFHHRLWTTHTVGRRGAWHNITALRKHTRLATSSVT